MLTNPLSADPTNVLFNQSVCTERISIIHVVQSLRKVVIDVEPRLFAYSSLPSAPGMRARGAQQRQSYSKILEILFRTISFPL